MEVENRRYIDDRVYGKYSARPWVYAEWTYTEKCARCKEITEVSYVYSYMDKVYLYLCDFDLQQYLKFGLITINKDGRVPNRDPHVPRPFKPQKPRAWNTKTYCEKCDQVIRAYGVSYPRENLDYLFVGECEVCGYKIEGDLSYIYSLKDTPAPFRPVKPASAPINFEEFKDSILGSKAITPEFQQKVAIPEHKVRLFCETCSSVKTFYGLPIIEDDDCEIFTGNCNMCNHEINGDIEEILAHSKHLVREAELKLEELAQEKNAEFAKSYSDEFFTNLRKKLRKPT